MRITLATCDERPEATDDDQLLVDGLRARGCHVSTRPWSSLDPDEAAGAIVLRSTWDYHKRLGAFRQWLDRVSQGPVRLINSYRNVIWNLDKEYLRQLELAGVSVPETRWLESPDEAGIHATLRAEGWARGVLKPRVSGTAYGTVVVTAGESITVDQLAPSRAAGALLQPYLAEIEQAGELSLIFLGGVYSHAVRKSPRAGEFRVQAEFGGAVAAIRPRAAVMALARAALALVPERPVYARVDIVEATAGPLLMELELIEPELFFRYHPAAAVRLADLLATGPL